MKGLKRFFKGILGYLRNEKGYTLAEMTAVVAVTATLTALAIPVVADKVQQGKLARAAMDVRGLNQALASFQNSLAFWPGDPNNPSYGGAAVTVLFVGSGFTPSFATGVTGWEAGDDASFHLVTNTDGTIDPLYTACSATTKGNCWAGPYMGSMREDPWGNNYLVYIKAFYDKTDTGYGWIISAGPDGVLNTDVTDSEIQGDDLGTMAFKARYESD